MVDVPLFRWLPLLTDFVGDVRANPGSVGPANEMTFIIRNPEPILNPGPPEVPPGELVSAAWTELLGIGSPDI